MMKKKVSLKDIAQAVGVSTALVSYVLNNKEKEARVGKEIAEVIRKTAEKMDYQPNQIAQSLKSGKSHTIGLIVADISNIFFANIARTIEDAAEKHNYTVIFGSSDENSEKSWKLINVLINRQVDGFIIAPTENSSKQIEYLNRQNIPFVLIDRYFPEIPSNYVITNNYQASYDAVLHLIDTGHKRIGLLSYKSDLVHIKERQRGYMDALKDNGLTPEISNLKEVKYTNVEEGVKKAMEELIFNPNPVDSVLFATNTLSIQGLKFLSNSSMKVPEDIAVVCFDESDAFDFFYSPITFIHQPIVEVGKEAVRLLLEQMNSTGTSKRQISIDSELIIRESSGAVVGSKKNIINRKVRAAR
jgi:LacI family transcriptional regulator